MSEEVYYYFESSDGKHFSELMPEPTMEFCRRKGEFGVLEPTGEKCGDNEVMAPHDYEIGKIYKRTYQVVMTEEEMGILHDV